MLRIASVAMRKDIPVWIAATTAILLTIASSICNLLLGININNGSPSSSHVRALMYIAFALQLTALGSLLYYTSAFARLIVKRQLVLIVPDAGIGFNVVALIIGGIGPIWLACSPRIVSEHSPLRSYVGVVFWVLTVVTHAVFFLALKSQVKRIMTNIKSQSRRTSFGIRLPPNKDLAYGTRPSFCSRDTTCASSRPGTAASRTYSLQSSTTRVASSLKSKLTRNSARSSLELYPFPAGEATVLGNAFDRYDTTNVSQDVRSTVLTPSKMTRLLDPIPGSRPNSPSDESPTLPTSPTIRQTPRSPTVHINQLTTSQPVSPPSSANRNFSRPASRARDTVPISESPLRQPRFSESMTELIHPLFRPDSPAAPPQILTSNTMVTASPLANQPITPKTLSRLRSTSDLRTKRISDLNIPSVPVVPTGTNHYLAAPSSSTPNSRPRSRSHSLSRASSRTSISGSDLGESSSLSKTTSMGSPGPSIVEEEELPPILPGFVLTAGSRSSLVGYGKRKSTRTPSAHLD